MYKSDINNKDSLIIVNNNSMESPNNSKNKEKGYVIINLF